MGCLGPTGGIDMFLCLATLPQNSLWLLVGLSKKHEHFQCMGPGNVQSEFDGV